MSREIISVINGRNDRVMGDSAHRPENGTGGPIQITTQEQLIVDISLDPAGTKGTADWWLLAQTPFGGDRTWYHYDLTQGWIPGFDITLQAPCVNVPTREVLRMRKLPPGRYTFYFGVDMNANGVLDFKEMFYDHVVVQVVKQP